MDNPSDMYSAPVDGTRIIVSTAEGDFPAEYRNGKWMEYSFNNGYQDLPSYPLGWGNIPDSYGTTQTEDVNEEYDNSQQGDT